MCERFLIHYCIYTFTSSLVIARISQIREQKGVTLNLPKVEQDNTVWWFSGVVVIMTHPLSFRLWR